MKLTVQGTRIDEQLISECSRINAADVSVNRIDSPAVLTANRPTKALEVTCRLIGFSGDAYYLRVSPEIIWLIPENGFSEDVYVVSNVKWTIE